MTLHFLPNIFSCFSEASHRNKRYVCNGDVCVLRNNRSMKNKRKPSMRISFARLSFRRLKVYRHNNSS
ncbi:hypothetical protein D8674_022222 [Pyrus ussuriensis x Pyrus communis]|uniref:Uncharacterized protein n=1 Tax=Pyrus ussuriensis x Pyrus communis TaxID=2448454 RepID=A0A5N5GY06_9ROSA|nr:hypothetical protein D8674_022222 [Pyrus ussuriensis x Pyrus communis]